MSIKHAKDTTCIPQKNNPITMKYYDKKRKPRNSVKTVLQGFHAVVLTRTPGSSNDYTFCPLTKTLPSLSVLISK